MRRSRCTSVSGQPLAQTFSVVCWVRSEVEQSTSSTPMPCSTSQCPALVASRRPRPVSSRSWSLSQPRCSAFAWRRRTRVRSCAPRVIPRSCTHPLTGVPRRRCSLGHPGARLAVGAEQVRGPTEGDLMSALDDILGALPADQISQQVGASPDEVRTAAAAVLPALLGGLQANAGDPAGAGSIVQALGQHDDDLLTGGVDLSAIDAQDGEAIASHIFGDQQDEVVNRLGGLPAVGGSGAGGALVRKLLPILAPMVLSWLANRVLKGGGGGLGGGTAAA